MRSLFHRMILASAALGALAGCGGEAPPAPSAQELASRDLAGVLEALCPTNNFLWDTFDARAQELGVKPDGGEVTTAAATGKGDVVRDKWVAVNSLGRRVTVWMAEVGPERVGEGVLGQENVQRTRSGLVCTAYDPTMSFADFEAANAAREGGGSRGVLKKSDGSLVRVRRAWVEQSTDNYYREFDAYARGEMVNDVVGPGVEYTRRSYILTN